LLKDQSVSLAKRAIPVSVKLATHGLLDFDKLTDEAKEAFAGLSAEFAKDKIEHYESDKNTVTDFKKRLEIFIKELGKQAGEVKKPVVFFVDELDRCRPTYTVE